MDIMKIKCTPKQEECIKYPKNRNLLIRGIAGSGKSLVILRRAYDIASEGFEKGEKRSIAIFTYANSLVSYTKEIVDKKFEQNFNIVVNTMDKHLKDVYNAVVDATKKGKRVYKLQFQPNKKILDNICDEVGEESKNRFLKPEMRAFLGDELAWMKQHMLRTEEQYLHVNRVGRGKTRPSEKDRSIIFKIYTKYYEALAEKNINDVDAIYLELYDRRDEIPDECKFDYVLIDESQDLPLNKLLLAAAITNKALTFAGDYAQKIYKTGFSWKELGIDMRGNSSKKLTGTFRNTRQIMELAECLTKHNTELMSMQDEYVAPELPTKSGPLPTLHYAISLTDEKDYILHLARQYRTKFPKDTIGIILPNNNKINWVAESLKTARIKFQLIQSSQDAEEFSIIDPGIKIVTFHSSKGLEFDHVILAFLEDGIFPYRANKYNTNANSTFDADSEEDEMNKARNLLYVGMTRARYTLFMIACDSNSSQPSPLIEELEPKLYQIKKD